MDEELVIILEDTEILLSKRLEIKHSSDGALCEIDGVQYEVTADADGGYYLDAGLLSNFTLSRLKADPKSIVVGQTKKGGGQHMELFGAGSADAVDIQVEIIETLSRVVTVKATSEREAISMAERMYATEVVVLDSSNHTTTEFNIYKD